jgi:hypothetical protein
MLILGTGTQVHESDSEVCQSPMTFTHVFKPNFISNIINILIFICPNFSSISLLVKSPG